MKKDEATKVENKKKLLLRRTTIRALDDLDLSLVPGGFEDSPAPTSHSEPPGPAEQQVLPTNLVR